MLTNKKRAFINEYISTLNATQSAIKSGYSVKTARSQGSRLLTDVDVKQAIDEGIALKCKESKLTKTSLLTKLSDIINSPDSKACDVTRAIEVASKILKLYKTSEGSRLALFQRIQSDIEGQRIDMGGEEGSSTAGEKEKDSKDLYIPKRNGYIEGEEYREDNQGTEQ